MPIKALQLAGQSLRKVTHLTGRKHAVPGRLKGLTVFSAFVISGIPVGTLIAALQ